MIFLWFFLDCFNRHKKCNEIMHDLQRVHAYSDLVGVYQTEWTVVDAAIPKYDGVVACYDDNDAKIVLNFYVYINYSDTNDGLNDVYFHPTP